ncbi:MAG: anthrax toxin lethal factor-related metalloendopeptidase [Anaerostipes hadrus]
MWIVRQDMFQAVQNLKISLILKNPNTKDFILTGNLDSGNYARTSTSDYFAECFRDYYFSANSRSKLKANCPKSYSFIQKTINKF